MIIYDMNVLILKHGMGSKAIAMAKECNISGGTVLLGKGTIRNSFLSFFAISFKFSLFCCMVCLRVDVND